MLNPKINSLMRVGCFSAGLWVALSVAAAVAELPVSTPTALPQQGTLATTGDRGFGSQTTPGQWGGMQIEGTSGAPVSASVSRGRKNDWVLKVFNNSTDLYSVNLALEQVSASGGVLKRDSFSINLAAGKSDSRSVPAHALSTGANVVLRNWRSISKESGAAKQAEVLPTPTAPAAKKAVSARANRTPTPTNGQPAL
jgi:hypothetical protein